MKLTVNGENGTITTDFDKPALLSELLLKSSAGFSMPCGGNGKCRKCKVSITGAASPMTETEKQVLSDEEKSNNIRLACMTRIIGDAVVTLPDVGALNILSGMELPETELKPWARGLGVAVDIGTTTVAAYLFDLSNGTLLNKGVALNPQHALGADVISRIYAALNGSLDVLCSQIRGCINDLIFSLCEDTDKIGGVCIVGNTAMQYLFTGRNPISISRAPFEQDCSFGEFLTATALGLCCKNARVYIAKTVSSFVGGDITAAVLSSGIYEGNSRALLVDIGTNGEIVLADNGVMTACSTAAGPAFEGVNLSAGMTASNGAINHVLYDGKITHTTIGETAIGICGSGIIDAVAVLLGQDIVDETGLMLTKGHSFESLTDGEEGSAVFTFPGTSVTVSQADIRSVQLGKAAIFAGIDTLINRAGLSLSDIDRLLLAGGFGNYMNTDSAERIGLIPAEKSIKKISIGNAAASGAALLLLSEDKISCSERLARSIKTVSLSTDTYFADSFIQNMMF